MRKVVLVFIIIAYNYMHSKAQQSHHLADSILLNSDGIYSKSKQSHHDSVATKRYESKNHKFAIGGIIGYGIPTEGYGTSTRGTVYGDNIGYADPGSHLDINFQYQIIKYWGILLESEGNINYINSDRFQGATSAVGYYYFGEYLAGLFYSHTYSSGNIFESWVAVGIITLYGKIYNVTPASSFNGWGAEAGLKLKKHITKGLYITFDFVFTQAQANKNYTTQGFVNYYGPIGLLNAGIGMEFKL